VRLLASAQMMAVGEVLASPLTHSQLFCLLRQVVRLLASAQMIAAAEVLASPLTLAEDLVLGLEWVVLCIPLLLAHRAGSHRGHTRQPCVRFWQQCRSRH